MRTCPCVTELKKQAETLRRREWLQEAVPPSAVGVAGAARGWDGGIPLGGGSGGGGGIRAPEACVGLEPDLGPGTGGQRLFAKCLPRASAAAPGVHGRSQGEQQGWGEDKDRKPRAPWEVRRRDPALPLGPSLAVSP